MTRITALELSASALVRITVAALVSALLALVLFVLPAEFDTDPTGVGELLGIKGMADIPLARYLCNKNPMRKTPASLNWVRSSQ